MKSGFLNNAQMKKKKPSGAQKRKKKKEQEEHKLCISIAKYIEIKS